MDHAERDSVLLSRSYTDMVGPLVRNISEIHRTADTISLAIL
jgi:hypothetical protein